MNIVEALGSFGWAGACYLAIAGHYWAAAAAALFGLAAPLAAWLTAGTRKE